jgi:PPOX class probable F420-dependent enzyme
VTPTGPAHTRRPHPEHLAQFVQHRFAVLTTLHPDGRPQMSLVQQHAHDGVLDISLTASRVKTRNLSCDARASVMILPDGTNRFVVAEGRAELTDVSRVPGDEVGRALADLYQELAGPHPDWDDYFRAMVTDRRLLCRIHVDHTYVGGA